MSNLIDEYLTRSSWRVKENANFTYSTSGLEAYVSGGELTEWSIKHSPAGKEHSEGWMHLHDLNKPFSPYCCGHSLETLLQKGIRVPLGANSKPAKHFSAILNHVNVYLSCLSQEFAGAQAFSDVDVLLAPFIYYDGLDYKATKQAIQELIYNLNYPARIAFQTVFSNFTFHSVVPSHLADKSVIWDGKEQSDLYSDFADEVEMFNRAFLEVMLQGDATARPFTFPLPTLNLTQEAVASPVYELWIKLAAKYGLPYFDNYIGTKRKVNCVRAMCCRLLIDTERLPVRGIWSMPANTGSIGVVTINMPLVGYVANNDGEVYEILDRLLDKAKEHLMWRREVVTKSLENGLLPLTKEYIGSFVNFYNTIGWVGLNEFCLNYFDSPLEEHIEYILELMRHIKARLNEWEAETGVLWNFEATPAEGACYSLALKSKKLYPDIITQGEGEDVYFTNSTYFGPECTLDEFEQIEKQAILQREYTGGTVLHFWLGELEPPVESLQAFIYKIASKGLPYFTISPTYSVCSKDGKMFRGEVQTCPECGSPTEVYSRVVGYYRPVSQWNRGKIREYKDRKRVHALSSDEELFVKARA